MKKVLYKLKDILLKNNLKLSTAESCTGGLISSFLTDVDGASQFIEQNFVTYAPFAKERFLNVKHNTIEKYGVVSKVYIGLGIKKENIVKTVKYNSRFKTRKAIKKDFAQTAVKELLSLLEKHFPE